MCVKPFRRGVEEFGCGSCSPCRASRRRLWSTRLMLEVTQHAFSWFVTLTYDDNHLPDGGSLCKRDLQLFIKRLRDRSGDKLRYYAVGEYGDRSNRPHYHLFVFGLSNPALLTTCWAVDGVALGFVHVGGATEASAMYLAGYVVKGLTRKDDVRLNGRAPEFSCMSLRPGIGAGVVGEIAKWVNSEGGALEVSSTGDVPSKLRWLREKRSLGRYLKGKIRMASGYPVSQAVKARSEAIGRAMARSARDVKVLSSVSYKKRGIL